MASQRRLRRWCSYYCQGSLASGKLVNICFQNLHSPQNFKKKSTVNKILKFAHPLKEMVIMHLRGGLRGRGCCVCVWGGDRSSASQVKKSRKAPPSWKKQPCATFWVFVLNPPHASAWPWPSPVGWEWTRFFQKRLLAIISYSFPLGQTKGRLLYDGYSLLSLLL